MNLSKIYLLLAAVASLLTIASCDDESNIGSSISKGEVKIEVDSNFIVTGESVRVGQFDSRSLTLLLGRLSAEGYGTLDCSYASQLMPAESLSIPDSISLDAIAGMKLKFIYDKQKITGDSLSPQQLSVYRLIRQLPSDINNLTDLSGYYDASSPIGVKSFTASSLTDNSKQTTGTISIPLSKELAQEIVKEYRTNPATFASPEALLKKFPGIYVKSTFGRGLVMNLSRTEFTTYYNYHRNVTVVKDDKAVVVDSIFTDSTTLFSVTPEVLSANLMRLEPSPSIMERIQAGATILQGPGGYNVKVKFPAQSIIDRYYNENFNLSVVNTLTYEIPVKDIKNDYGISRPPYLLMVKTSILDKFFLESRLPQEDDTECFYAQYNSKTDSYVFNGLRPYIVKLMQAGGKVAPEDEDFTIVPATITTETVGSGTTAEAVVVTNCRLYIDKPVLCLLDIPHSKVKFTYSRQYRD